jgi:hypothetical protein
MDNVAQQEPIREERSDDAVPQEAQIIHVPNTLRAKVGSGTRIDPKLIRDAQSAVDGMAGDFRNRAVEELEMVSDLVSDAPDADDLSAHYELIFGMIHDLKGQGSTFGYTLLTSIGDNLCRYMHKIEKPSLHHLTIIAPHIEALKAVARLDVKGDDDPIGKEIVNSLHVLSSKMG